MSDISKILEDIKKIRTKTSVWAPSLAKNVEVFALTLAQQKTIIETAIDSNLSVLFFNTTFYKILESNCSEKMSDLNTIDRVNLALALRGQLKDGGEQDNVSFSIKEIMAANKPTHLPEPKIIESTNFKFHVRVPSLEYDNRINSILLKKYKDENVDSSKLKSLISDLFSYEIFKFIEKIEVQSTGSQILMKDNINQNVSIIESLDSAEFVRIVEYINGVRDAEKALTKIPGFDSYIELVPDFFVV
jgi:hypothetical protein